MVYILTHTLPLFFLALVLIAGVACLFVSLFRRRFEECAAMAIAAIFLVLYLLVLTGLLRLAIPAVALLAAAGLFLLLFRYFTKRDPDALTRLITPGFVAFFGVSLFACVLIMGTVRFVYAWDEYSHWIIAVKELWLVDAGEAAFRSVVSMPYYPPFAALVDFFFLKMTGAFSEPMTYVANVVISFSLLLPILRSFPWKKWGAAVVCTVFLCLLPLVLFVDAVASLYVDCLMGLLIGYVFFIYFSAPKKDWFVWLSVSAGLCMLSMIKNVGVEICLIPLAVIGADWLFVQRKEPTVRRTFRQNAVLFLVCGAVMFLAHGVWHTYLHGLGIGSDFVANAEAGSRLAGFPNEVQLRGLRVGFWLLFNNYDRLESKAALSIVTIAALLVLVGLFILYRARGKKEHKTLCFFVGGVTAGLFAYAAEMALAMVLTFEPAQAIVMLSFERYIDTYLLAMLVSFAGVLIERRRAENTWLCVIAVLCILIPFMDIGEAFDFIGGSSRDTRRERREIYTTAVETLETLDPQEDTVCYIDQGNTKFGLYFLRYALAPLPVEYCGNWNIGAPTEEYDISRKEISPDEWAALVLESDCNYVFIHNTDESFLLGFSGFFPSAADIGNDRLYQITERAPGELLLVPAS